MSATIPHSAHASPSSSPAALRLRQSITTDANSTTSTPTIAPDADPDSPRSYSQLAEEARPSSRPLPISRNTVSTGNAASSLSSYATTQSRLPARSFVSSSANIAPESAHYSSAGVREETAELAAWTFSKQFEKKFSPSGRLPSFSAGSENVTRNDGGWSLSAAEDRSHALPARISNEMMRPEVIEEVSEPSTPLPHSPEGAAARMQSGISKLMKGISRKISQSDQRPQDRDSTSQWNAIEAGVQTSTTNERTPLLPPPQSDAISERQAKAPSPPSTSSSDDLERQMVPKAKKLNHFQMLMAEGRWKVSKAIDNLIHPKQWNARSIYEQGIKQPVSLLPCVFLGLLLNILDALSYGMILFPLGEDVFANTGADGISMFYVSCIVSQLVFSFGGSVFKGAIGSEMIEIVPFMHKMAYTVNKHAAPNTPHVILATTITAYALSCILTGLVFFLLGALRLGSLVNFFPRHILIGCIGGVGFFLFSTGIEVTARLEDSLDYNYASVQRLFQADTIALWTIPLALAIILLGSKNFTSSPYLVPCFFIAVASFFYIVVAAVPQLNLADLREIGWVFPVVKGEVPFYHFYTYYDFRVVDWAALGQTVPAMFALTFFGLLHVPINIPALGIAAQEDDLNLNRELVAHGLSNVLSGLVGSIQNYLVYANSEMFISNGGNNRLAGVMLAVATVGVWIAGPGMIGFVPIMLVGALIFYLAISLLEEALFDTWGRMHRLEYLTVVVIVLVMGVYDFVAGVLVGIILACLNFVVQTSQKSAIRASWSGDTVESTVRRHPIQRHFLREVGYQVHVTKLAGFLFFGSIVKVEKQSRALIEEEAFRKQPIRYLIFDLAHVSNLDYSAAEAFSRMERVLGRRDVRLIVSGAKREHEVGRSLQAVGLWQDQSSVQFFESLNSALEFCENELLKAFYRQQRSLNLPFPVPRRSSEYHKSENRAVPGSLQSSTIGENNNPLPPNSPRQRYLEEAATITLDSTLVSAPKRWTSFKRPLPLILQTFQNLTDKNEDFWFRAVPYFEEKEYKAGEILFKKDEEPESFFLLESGIIRAKYTLPQGSYRESIVAGTTCGELPFFSNTPRTATAQAERDCVVWRMSDEGWRRMQIEWPEGATEVLRVALKLTKERVDAVTSYVLTTAG